MNGERGEDTPYRGIKEDLLEGGRRKQRKEERMTRERKSWRWEEREGGWQGREERGVVLDFTLWLPLGHSGGRPQR